ncbi:glycosyltransferase [Paenibacillus sp. J2TS4]|uniref:glycosyltransferase n=1 Tax=Paenibacillus sp. J2TS4 TaxID=2807194 RepID=UPI001B042489|nr:glycosyltransferase [Paenibacillus sp. J2TS4]GIP35119.1 hypothetical protein J2TS4_43290 [Paenibacillus sp. J2TS4]
MARILFTTQNYSLGGLEAQIAIFSEKLKEKGHEVYIATSSTSDITPLTPYIKKSLMTDEWMPLTGSNVYALSYKLKEFIEKNKIDVVHAHPYEGFIPASIAASISNVPYVLTIHSPLNLAATYGSIYRLFMSKCLLPSASSVFCVSKETKDVVQQITKVNNLHVLANPINFNLFSASDLRNNTDFLVISRLDEDKIPGIKKVIELFDYLQQRGSKPFQLKIVGDGNKKNDLMKWVEDNSKNSSLIKFLGRKDNVQSFMREAKVVFGMGRVVVEAGAMNVPVVLTGYDNLIGFVTIDNVDELSEKNFSGRGSLNSSFEQITENIHNLFIDSDKYSIRERLINHYSAERIYESYIDYINSATIQPTALEWSESLLSLCQEVGDQNILDFKIFSKWLDKVDLGLSTEVTSILNISTEFHRLMEENRNLSVQLGMTNQHLHDLTVYTSSNDEKEKQQIKLLLAEKDKQIELLRTEKDKQIELLRTEKDKQMELLHGEIERQKSSSHSEQDYIRLLSIENEKLLKEREQQAVEISRLITEKKNAEILRAQISKKIYEISSLKSLKLVNGLRRFKHQFIKGNIQEKKEFYSWAIKKISKRHAVSKVNYNPLHELWGVLEGNLSAPSTTNLVNTQLQDNTFNSEYIKRNNYYSQFLKTEFSKETIKIINLIKEKQYKGIVVYPEAIEWEPVQRPQQFLRELAARGYLCFFCYSSDAPFDVREEEENLFLLNKECYLLPILRSQFCIILCSWPMQSAFADLLPHKFLWYDVLDQLEFFSLYDQNAQLKHNELLKSADIVSYSAHRLKKYVAYRDDALYLPNGVKTGDFKNNQSQIIPKEISNLVKKGNPIIGYYGAIEQWFDSELIKELAEKNPHWQFFFIGKNNLDQEDLIASNIHFLGQIEYNKLFSYAVHFDVAIIPFKVNDLTNCVSPVKFFEYQAIGLPVVSTPIAEMLQYENDFVAVANNSAGFSEAIEKLLNNANKDLAIKEGKRFADANRWSSRIDIVEKKIKASPRGWLIYSNYCPNNKIAVMTSSFLSFNGDNYYSGGAERYLIDLFELASKLGYSLTIYQYGNYPWIRKFRNIDVVSLSRNGQNTSEFSIECVQNFNRFFYEQVVGRSILNIYSAFFEAWPLAAKPSIGISHGVAWDNPSCRFDSGSQFWETNRRFIDGAKACEYLVSVDTNTANWMQTIDYDIGHKVRLVTNYVDLNEFKPRPDYEIKKEKIIILYPRRLYEARGLYIVLDILDDILDKYPQVEFHFVGKGFEEDTNNVVKKKNKWGDRVKWYWLDPEKMPSAYYNADITLIPTLYSEGTSLSCLEAMAAGNAVIATRIGGLTDLVLNNYNGFLIDPNSESLQQAIETLVNDPDRLKIFKRRGREIAEAFSKQTWQEKWRGIISSKINDEPTLEQKPLFLVEIYVCRLLKVDELGPLISFLLTNGCLVYIYTKDDKVNENLSFGRLQWMEWGGEKLSRADLVLAEKNILDKIEVAADFVISADGVIENLDYELIKHLIKKTDNKINGGESVELEICLPKS